MNNENNMTNTPAQQNPNTGTPDERNRKFFRIAGIVILVVVILALAGNRLWKHGEESKESNNSTLSTEGLPDGCAPGALFNTKTGKPCPQPSDASGNTPAAATSASTGNAYDDAIHQYAGKLVIFDENCAAMPQNPTFAVGTRILVANNSTKTLTLSAAGKTKELAPYHYFTVSLTTAGSAAVTCNGATAATVTVK